jgi:hypothetical protein
LYETHSEKYKAVSAMDITQLCPNLLLERMAVSAKAGDVLLFHPRVTHGTSDNLSEVPHLRCYPNIGPINSLPNSTQEVMQTYTTGAHPKRYAHFYTGNQYKQNVAFARSARPHFTYPVNNIGGALLGVKKWDDIEVGYSLCALFNEDKQLQNAFIAKWVDEYYDRWKAMVDMQIAMYVTN